ncbi:enoyl-CoA hydratase/isomerase family protein [Alphaproteobacteria bacterium LSUCC0684]
MNTIHLEQADGVAKLTLNRPDVLNAINEAMVAETNAAMAELAADDQVRAIVVTGAGRSFSAGFDMKEAAAKEISGRDAWREVLLRDFDFVMQFWTCPKPTIAAVHGYCLAGAFELMLATDISVADRSALFGMPEVRFGSGIITMLAPWVTGPKQAKELLLTGHDRFTADQCLTMGVINRVVADGTAGDEAHAIASQIAHSAAKSVQLTKQAINRSYEMARMREALDAALEIDLEIESDESPERLEFNSIRKEKGLKAALAWRDSKFT